MTQSTLKQSFTKQVNRLPRISAALIFLLVMTSSLLQAQHKRQILNLPNYDKQFVHFGFILGVNTFNFTVKPISDIRSLDSLMSITPQRSSGFSLGFLSNFHLGDNLDLRVLPTLSFGERSLVYNIKNLAADSIYERVKPVESTLIELPILLKFKSQRHGNYRAYVIGGIKPTIDMASQDKVDSKGEKLLKLRRNDYHYELGMGFDFYSQYFKFSPEIKLAFGMRNLMIPEGNIYTSGVEKLTSRAIYLSFTFE